MKTIPSADCTFIVYTGDDTSLYKNGEVYYVREINTVDEEKTMYTIMDLKCNTSYVTEDMMNTHFMNIKDIKTEEDVIKNE